MDKAPYDIKKPDAEFLMGVRGLPHDVRCELLHKYFWDHGITEFVFLFSQFVALSESVVENNREMIEFYLITEHNHEPRVAEKLNLPTIFGALQGVVLAKGVDQDKLCHGCAYRLGSCANQSPVTTSDCEHQAQNSDMFYCHAEMNEDGSPKHKCRGFLQKRKNENDAD